MRKMEKLRPKTGRDARQLRPENLATLQEHLGKMDAWDGKLTTNDHVFLSWLVDFNDQLEKLNLADRIEFSSPEDLAKHVRPLPHTHLIHLFDREALDQSAGSPERRDKAS